MAEPRIDWDEWAARATEWLSDYIRIDTVNPPGNEMRACDWLGRILDAEGIPYTDYKSAPERGNLVARIEGTGTRGKGLILLNHTDVVPFERDHWTVEPLGGEISEGYIWGRGAQDMKGMGIMELVVFLLHHRLGLPLMRDLVFMAVADEEAGSEFGVEYLDAAHPELLDCEYVINEGGGGSTEVLGVQRNTFNIGVAEKGPSGSPCAPTVVRATAPSRTTTTPPTASCARSSASRTGSDRSSLDPRCASTSANSGRPESSTRNPPTRCSRTSRGKTHASARCR